MHKHILSALRANASARVLAVALGIPFALAGHHAQASALPGRGHFVSGQGSIGKGDQSLTVKQSSTTGIINWKSFSIGSANSVTFDNGHGATLNRVTGGNLSTIAGSLHATGSLYLMNSQGVIVTGTGKVVTGGSFVATSGGMSNAAFDDGDRRFKPGAGIVVNKGTIVSGGAVGLSGRDVSESGVVRAGSVELSATQKLGISGSISAANSDGNGGAITARARTIVIGTTGLLNASANTAGKTGGIIHVVARDSATIAGRLEAEGGTKGSGGFIETSGQQVHVADGAYISTLAANGKSGSWLIDPQDYTVAASGGDITGATLSGALANGNVEIQSSSGATVGSGDINIDDTVSWSTGSKLTLDAYRNINVNAAVSVTGAGGVALIYGDQAQNGTGNIADGDMSFDLTSSGFDGHIDFVTTNNDATLSINGTNYALLYTLNDLADINTDGGLQGNYALAGNLDDANATWTPLGTDGGSTIKNGGNGFSGSFTGLGHTVANINVNIGLNSYAGLFGYASGPISDVGVAGGSVQAGSNSAGGTMEYIGGLVGSTTSTLSDSFATDSVSVAVPLSNPTGSGVGEVGGLAGYAGGEISNSFAAGVVNAEGASQNVGGLAGSSGDGIVDSYATGQVSGFDSVGGLAGVTGGIVNNSYATGAVSGVSVSSGTIGQLSPSTAVGGLIGSQGATVSNSYATGAVGGSQDVGGLIGSSSSNVNNSYAIGPANGSSAVGGLVGLQVAGTISDSYASGSATLGGQNAEAVGGLVGIAQGAVTDSYATGAVIGGGGSRIGGLIGEAEGAVTNVYATGAVVNGNGATNVGGLVGFVNGATLSDAYWDKQTSGQSSSAGGTGLTTAQMQSGSAVFSGNAWGGGTKGLYPYLTSFFPNGVEAISGTAYDGAGETLAPGSNGGIVVTLDANDGYLAQGSVGANGYYYIMVPAGTIANGSTLVSYIPTSVPLGTTNAAAFAASTYTASTPAQTGVDLHEGYLSNTTSATELSALNLTPDVADATASDSTATGALSALTQTAYWITGNSFTFDQAYTGNGFQLETKTNDPINVSSSVTINGGGSLTLVSGGALSVSVDVAAGGGSTVNLTGSSINFDGGHLAFTGTANSLDMEGTLGFYDGGRVSFDSTNNILTINNNSYTLVDSVTALATVANASPSGNYALADNYDATNDAVWSASPVVNQFLGRFEGLGNAITGMSIVDTSGNDNVGLFADLEGSVSDLTLASVGVTGGAGANVGALAGVSGSIGDGGGINNVHVTGFIQAGTNSVLGGIVGSAGSSGGTITNSSIGGTVLAGDSSQVGGIAGLNLSDGSISQSYSTANVSAGSSSDVGGLVGTNQGAINESYAAGIASVSDGTSGDKSEIGGLVGSNDGGSISDSYSLTYVMGQGTQPNTEFGGLVGTDNGNSGSVSDSFWDTQTSGIASASQGAGDVANTAGITGVTSTALKAGLPGSFSHTDWSIVAGSSFPYLTSQFAPGDTPQVISGTSNDSGLALAALSGGAAIGQMNSFADTSFYLLVAPHTVAETGVAVYDTNNTSTMGFSDSSWTGLTLADDVLSMTTQGTSLTTLGANVGATLGTVFSNGGPAPTTLGAVLADIGNTAISISATGAFNVDQALSTTDVAIATGGDLTVSQALSGSEDITVDVVGKITETGAGAISTGGLLGSSQGAVTLGGANQIGTLDGFNTGGNNAFSLTNGTNLSVGNPVNAGTAALTLTTTGSGHGIAVNGALEAGTVDLVSAGGISENSLGAIDATMLKGSAQGAVTLTGTSNAITNLGAFTTGSGAFSLTDAASLTVDGALGISGGNLTLKATGASHNLALHAAIADSGHTIDLISAGTIAQNSAGTLTGRKLTGSSVGGTALTAANDISDLGAFSTGGNNAFSLSDAANLVVDGAVSSGTAATHLTTTGAGHNIAVDAKVTAGDLDLVSAATITEGSAGDLDATKLEGSSAGTAEMTSATNAITDLSTFTSGSTFELTDDHDLTVDGTLNAGTHTVKLTTKGSGHDIAVDAKLEGGTVKLTSGATIIESSAGDLDATKLEGSSSGTTKLTSTKNTITDLGTFSTGGNKAFELSDDHALTVDGTVTAGTGTLDLTTTGTAHNLAIDSAITGGTINLVTTGEATESGAGAITASTILNVTADTGIELTSKKNKIKKLGTDKTKKGQNKVTL